MKEVYENHFSNRIEDVRAKKNKFDLNIQVEIMTMYHFSVLSTKIFSSRSLEISQKFSSQGISLVATNDTNSDNNQQQSIFISAPKKIFEVNYMLTISKIKGAQPLKKTQLLVALSGWLCGKKYLQVH